MQIGDIVETSVWITGDEPPEMRKQYEQDVEYAITDVCQSNGFKPGKITFHVKHPDDSDVPPVPDKITGSCVRLLCAEARVEKRLVQVKKSSFVDNLDKKDLRKLRDKTRKALGRAISNAECDEIIEELGPQVVLESLGSHSRIH